MKKPRIYTDNLAGTTLYGPLVAIGDYVRRTDLLSPLTSRVMFRRGTHTERPADALIDLWLSMLAGCRSVRQINTKLRPDRTLAQSWGRCGLFAEQSTIARVLDRCGDEQVTQLRAATYQLHRWIGQSYRHDWSEPLLVDIDLTELPASKASEGSTKGYFQKKGGADANCDASAFCAMMRV